MARPLAVSTDEIQLANTVGRKYSELGQKQFEIDKRSRLREASFEKKTYSSLGIAAREPDMLHPSVAIAREDGNVCVSVKKKRQPGHCVPLNSGERNRRASERGRPIPCRLAGIAFCRGTAA